MPSNLRYYCSLILPPYLQAIRLLEYSFTFLLACEIFWCECNDHVTDTVHAEQWFEMILIESVMAM